MATMRTMGTFANWAPALSACVIAAAFLTAAYRYPAAARAFPVAVGWVALGLALLDLTMATGTTAGRGIMKWLNPSIAQTAGAYSFSTQIQGILWLAVLAAMIVLIGILYAVPLYVFASLRWRGGRSWLKALLAAGIATAGVWLLFSVALQLELYRGYLFGGGL